MSIAQTVRENSAGVQARIEQACLRAGRDPASVTLVAVTKYARLDWVRALLDLGHRDLGENRPQQLAARARELPEEVIWHLIGPLQRNKVRLVLPITARIHSVDSLRLLHAILRIAGETQASPRLLLEVQLSGEPGKHGFQADELVASWPDVLAAPGVSVGGLMTMAAYSPDPERARPVFAALRGLRDRLDALSPPDRRLTELSMGMSGDFEVAIEEGATLVRVGSALWSGLDSG